jgi:hypothetical protein
LPPPLSATSLTSLAAARSSLLIIRRYGCTSEAVRRCEADESSQVLPRLIELEFFTYHGIALIVAPCYRCVRKPRSCGRTHNAFTWLTNALRPGTLRTCRWSCVATVFQSMRMSMPATAQPLISWTARFLLRLLPHIAVLPALPKRRSSFVVASIINSRRDLGPRLHASGSTYVGAIDIACHEASCSDATLLFLL